jgi:hypothetical protein
MKIRPVEAELFYADRRRDRQTYMTDLIIAFHNFANAPKILQITTTFTAVLPQISSPNSGACYDAVQQGSRALSFSSTLHFCLQLSRASSRTTTFGKDKASCYLN